MRRLGGGVELWEGGDGFIFTRFLILTMHICISQEVELFLKHGVYTYLFSRDGGEEGRFVAVYFICYYHI